MPLEMRDDTAFMDRIHAYLPGWDAPGCAESCSTTIGLVSDFLSKAMDHLRFQSRIPVLQGRFFPRRLERPGRERGQQNHERPAQTAPPRPRGALGGRGSVMGRASCHEGAAAGEGAAEKDRRRGVPRHTFQLFHRRERCGNIRGHPELQSQGAVGSAPPPPGWAISPGAMDDHAGLHRIEA